MTVFTPTAVQAVAHFMSTFMSSIVNQHLISAIKNAEPLSNGIRDTDPKDVTNFQSPTSQCHQHQYTRRVLNVTK